MNKCEHGERISLFCVTDNCQSKEAGGCQACLKKYHCHLTQLVQVREEEVGSLLRKFALENAVKPKCRILQEAVYSYFNEVKGEVAAALETACKNIINQIGYPYLFATNNLTTYKRLKNKEYRKIQQKEFKSFHELASKLAEKDLAREEGRIYHAEIKTVSEIIAQLDGHLRGVEQTIKNYSGAFVHDSSYLAKIAEVIKSISTESPSRVKRSTEASKDTKELPETKYTSKEAPKFTLINSPHAFLQGNSKLDYKNLEAKASELKQRVEKVQAEVEPLLPVPSIQLPTSSKGRDISLDKKLVREHKFGQGQQGSQGTKEGSEPRLENLKLQLNHKEIEINEKKKILLDIMKQERQEKPQKAIDKQEKALEKLESVEISPIKMKPSQYMNYPKREQLSTDTKSVNESKSSKSSQDLSGLSQEEQPKVHDTKNYAFTKLPIVEEAPKKIEEKTAINRKLLIVPTDLNLKGINSNKVSELDSPLYKKRKVQNYFEKKEDAEGKYELFGKKTEAESKMMGKEVVEIKDNQQKSLALLLKSLSLSAEEAVPFLQSSLKYAENNLSAAQYLSYLYLELSRPKDCLSLCNKMLDKLESTSEPQSLSINITNNKAAALNVLGRYSQAILILEQCVRTVEKDTSYKNLGDSYFNIGMLDKAIGNYEKSLKINSHNDECHYNLAVSLYMQQNYEIARTEIRKAIEMQPKNEAYLQLEGHIISKIRSN